MARAKQQGRMAAGSRGGARPRVPLQPYSEYTTYAQRKKAGGFTGDLTGLERVWLLYGDYIRRHHDWVVDYPIWFEVKFEIPPAHKFNDWEL